MKKHQSQRGKLQLQTVMIVCNEIRCGLPPRIDDIVYCSKIPDAATTSIQAIIGDVSISFCTCSRHKLAMVNSPQKDHSHPMCFLHAEINSSHKILRKNTA